MPNAQLAWRDSGWRYWWVVVAVFVLDQVTKYAASVSLNYLQPVEMLPVFNLTLVHNTGAAFSFLSDAGGWQRWFFSLLAIGVSGFVMIWLRKTPVSQVYLVWGLVLLLAGALGNLVDRLLFGYVVDFLDFHWAGWHFPAFNVADVAISLGAVALVLDAFLQKKDAE